MTRLEQQLYWAFEQSAKSVIKAAQMELSCGGVGHDPYAAHHAAAKLHYQIDRLSPDDAHLLKAKYGLLPESLQQVAHVVQRQFGYDQAVSCGMVLAWLSHPKRPRVHQLADMMDVSERTVKRKTRDVFCFLDDWNSKSLQRLSERLAPSVVPIYNQF